MQRPATSARVIPSASAMRFAIFCGSTLLVFATSGCEHHVQLKFPDTSPGAEYTCFATKSQVVNCRPATTINPANNNQANTVFVILPRECAGRVNEITIHDSGSSNPSVDVKCAPLENTIQ
jgi:hypothetical protein